MTFVYYGIVLLTSELFAKGHSCAAGKYGCGGGVCVCVWGCVCVCGGGCVRVGGVRPGIQSEDQNHFFTFKVRTF